MDIKGKIEEIVDKVKNDKDFAAKFSKDPTGAVSDLLGVDIPKDQVDSVVTAIKSKVSLDKASDLLGGLFGKK